MAFKSLLCLSPWLLVQAFSILPLTAADPRRTAPQPAVISLYDRLPLGFEANHGQASAEVQYVAHSRAYSLLLKRREMDIVVADPSTDQSHVMRMKLLGANRLAKIVAESRLPGDSNYFVGNESRHWHTNIPTFGQVRFRRIYPGIDLVFRGTNRQLEYDLILSPGADPRTIRLYFEHSQGLTINPQGDLVLRTGSGIIRQHKPLAYQLLGTARQPIPCRYTLRGKRTVGINAGPYDPARPLTIDPVLSYSTYLGGTGNDVASGISIDSAGNAYITGASDGIGFPPTQGSLQSGLFVIKLNHEGNAVVYSTYLGSATPNGIANGAGGDIYLTGWAYAGFPVVNPIQNYVGGPGCGPRGNDICPDAFVAKLSYTGSALVYSTYLGGTGNDQGNGIATDAAGNAYVTGSTRAKDFPTTASAFQRTSTSGPVEDAFISKINTDGSALVYSTYLGGENATSGKSIAVDYSGNVYVAGQTLAKTFPTTRSALQTMPSGLVDAFVTKLNAAGSALIYSTYLGGSDNDLAATIAIDASGSAYVAGSTSSKDLPIASAYQPACGGCPDSPDAFIAKLDPVGSNLLYSTYLGGSAGDGARAIAIDGSGNAYLVGVTYSADFPTLRAIPNSFTGASGNHYPHAFVTGINPAGSDLLFSSYLGGSGFDYGIAICLYDENELYVAGSTSSGDFAVLNPLQSTYGGGQSDAFVTRILLSELSKRLLTPAALSNGWPTKKYVLNDAGTVVFAGGDFQGQADGIVSSSPTNFIKFAALGDPVPESPGNVFAGFPMGDFGDLALNQADEVAFTASFVLCSSAAELASCLTTNHRVNGLFLYSRGQIRKIALEGDPVPGRAGYHMQYFRRVLLNNARDIVLECATYQEGRSSDLKTGLLLYHNGQIQTIAHDGDPTPRGSTLRFGFNFPLLLGDDGRVFFFLLYDGGAFGYDNGRLTQILGPGDRSLDGASLTYFREAAVNARGEAVLHASFGSQPFEQGLFLLRQDGTILRILKDGDPTPAGGRFSLWFEYADRFGNKRPADNSLSPLLNDSGMVAFSSPIKGGTTSGGLYVFDGDGIQKIVASGDPIPDLPQKQFGFAGYYLEQPLMDIQYVLNNLGEVVFNPGHAGLFFSSDGQIATLAMRGDLTPAIDGRTYALQGFDLIQLNNSETAAFQAPLCCGKYMSGMFLASLRLPKIPNGGFNVPGENDLPAAWTTSWTNSGKAQAFQYYGADSFEGSATLRLHVQTGGGSVFVLSDPVAIAQETYYLLACRMRFNFDSPSDKAFFSLIHFDSKGGVIGFNEVEGLHGESRWTWESKRMLIHIPPGTAFIRIRFGLITNQENYLDVDALR
jgi:hypothetical protein